MSAYIPDVQRVNSSGLFQELRVQQSGSASRPFLACNNQFSWAVLINLPSCLFSLLLYVNKMPLKFELCPGRMIGGSHPCFIIAEIGQNHQGDIEIAKKMIKMAKVKLKYCVQIVYMWFNVKFCLKLKR